MQEQVLKIEHAFPGLPQFIHPLAYRLNGPLNVAALDRSLIAVIRRHELLRTGFEWRGGTIIAVITPPDDAVSILAVEDFTISMSIASDQADQAKELLLKKAELIAELAALTPFDTRRAPLMRARLLRLGADDHLLLLTLHEAIVDAWSMQILMDELSEFYNAFSAGRQPALKTQSFSFPNSFVGSAAG